MVQGTCKFQRNRSGRKLSILKFFTLTSKGQRSDSGHAGQARTVAHSGARWFICRMAPVAWSYCNSERVIRPKRPQARWNPVTFNDLSRWPLRSLGPKNPRVTITHWVQQLCQISSKLKGVGSTRLRFDMEWPMSQFSFLTRIEFIRSKLSNFSAHVSGVTDRWIRRDVDDDPCSTMWQFYGTKMGRR